MIALAVAIAVFAIAAWDAARRWIAWRSHDAHLAINARVDKMEREHAEHVKDLHNRIAKLSNHMAGRKIGSLSNMQR